MKQTAVEWLVPKILELNLQLSLRRISQRNCELEILRLFEQAKEMQDEQMQLTWNNAMDAVQKDKWHSYYEFYNNNFKSE